MISSGYALVSLPWSDLSHGIQTYISNCNSTSSTWTSSRHQAYISKTEPVHSQNLLLPRSTFAFSYFTLRLKTWRPSLALLFCHGSHITFMRKSYWLYLQNMGRFWSFPTSSGPESYLLYSLLPSPHPHIELGDQGKTYVSACHSLCGALQWTSISLREKPRPLPSGNSPHSLRFLLTLPATLAFFLSVSQEAHSRFRPLFLMFSLSSSSSSAVEWLPHPSPVLLHRPLPKSGLPTTLFLLSHKFILSYLSFPLSFLLWHYHLPTLYLIYSSYY